MLDLLQTLHLPEFFSLKDLIDIFIVSILIYRTILLIRGTRASQMLSGIIMIIAVYFIAAKLNLLTLRWLVQTFLQSILLVIIIVFQSDLRRVLMKMGQSPFHRHEDIRSQHLEELIKGATHMAKRGLGALIVIERDVGLRDYIESGQYLDAELLHELLISIFLTASPLHDGGVIITNGRIHSAGCLLPLSNNPYISKHYGTRHRAALGLSEETDAVVIVVSEETQDISLVHKGKITRLHDEQHLRTSLRSFFTASPSTGNSFRQFISTIFPKK